MDNPGGGTYDDYKMIDAHAHLSFLSLAQVEELLSKGTHSIQKWILGGYNPQEWAQQWKLKALGGERLQTTIGLHPWYVCEASIETLNQAFQSLEEQISKAEWLGEMGLDFYGDQRKNLKQRQIDYFSKQLHLAHDYNKMGVFHVVQGWGEFLKCWDACPVPGFIHGFSGSVEIANELISRGLLISIGPGVLKDNYKNLRSVVKSMDESFMLIESDSPSEPSGLASYEGEDLLRKILQEVSSLRGQVVENLEAQLLQNFKKLTKRSE